MKITVRKLIICIGVFFVLSNATNIARACGCPSVGQPLDKLRAYYKESFSGAVFTGKIRTVRDAPGIGVGDFNFALSEVVIDVDLYWLGVSEPVVTAYTLAKGTSCSVEWETGKNLFFIASRQNDRLHIGMCDLSSWIGRYPDKEWSDYTEQVLGPAKSFIKTKK